MSATTFLCLLGLIVALAPVCMMAAVLIDRWSLERTEYLIDDAVFENNVGRFVDSEPWEFWFTPIENDVKKLGISHKFVFTTNRRPEFLK